MPRTYFRTHVTGLSDDELTLLDVMFDSIVVPNMLRRCNIYAQFLMEPHSLENADLEHTLTRFLREGIIRQTERYFRDQQYIAITPYGASLWSSERCPVWERFCVDRIFSEVGERRGMSVCAVSATIRDDYLRIAHRNIQHLKRAIIRDIGLLEWKSFERLHVGLVVYRVPKLPAVQTQDSVLAFTEERWRHIRHTERDRTWWRCVGELQKFCNPERTPET